VADRERGLVVGAVLALAGLSDAQEKSPPASGPRKETAMSSLQHAVIVRHPNAPPAQLIDPQEFFAMPPADPREQRVEDKYATPDSVARAKEAQLTERVRALNEVGENTVERDRLLALFVDDEQPEPAKRDMFDDLRDMYASLPEDAKKEFCYDTMRAVAKARMLSVSHAAERVLGLL
jgi:hypothetical protein